MKNLFLLLVLFIYGTSYTQEVGISSEVEESILKRIEYGLTPSIAVGVIDKDGPKYYMYGKTSKEGEEVDKHTIYEIGSISKVFTGILLANLAEKEMLAIDDDVQKHLPGSVEIPTRNGEKITLGHLSDHTSGLTRMPNNFTPSNPANPYADYTVDQMYDFLSSHELRRDIGSEYEYSNLAQGLLGHTLALVAQTTYEELMVNVIANELGMNETRIALNKKMKKNLALGHSDGSVVENWDIPTLAGAGAIRSSVHDMLIFLAANLGLKESDLAQSMELSHLQRHKKGPMGVGLAWHIAEGEEGPVIWHNGGTGGYRTFAGFVKETGKGVVVLTNSTAGADDIGMRMLNSGADLREIKPSATTALKNLISEQGIEQATVFYKNLETERAEEYDFSESAMNNLGYEYLSKDMLEEALAVFKLNVESFPNSSNVYDSYGEALRENGQTQEAIKNYKKSIELNPANSHGIEMLKEMGVEVEAEEVVVEESILDSYIGSYNLAPGFNIDITKEGSQLFAQATGQARFELFAKSDTEFYLKVVNAQITFTMDEDGMASSLTLYQGGQEVPGKRVVEE